MHKLSFIFFLFVSLLLFLKASAQDTIVLMNGKKIYGNVVEIKERSVKYTKGANQKGRIHSIKTYRVFAVERGNGAEEIIFKQDTIDEPGFTVDSMRFFIKGEQAAQAGYHDTFNKTFAFIIGGGASYFSIYGLVIPAIYSSVAGSYSPNINKQKNADPALINNASYQDGYLKVTRDKKIRNSFVAGMIGFAAGFTVQAIIGNNTKK